MGERAELVVYGSTLIMQFAQNEGVDFPLKNMKSSDIDIGVFEKGFKRSGEHFTDKFIAHAAPIIKQAIKESGFSYCQDTEAPCAAQTNKTALSNIKGKYIEDISEVPDTSFIKDFFVAKEFTPNDIEQALRTHPDYERLKSQVPQTPLTVRLVIGANELPFPMLLNPIETIPINKSEKFNRMTKVDMLAGKIVRCMTNHYKATDLLDIYNLSKGFYKSNGEPFIDLDPASTNNELDTVRALIVSYMPMSRGITATRPDLISVFDDNQEKKSKFLKALQPLVSSQKFHILEEQVDNIYKTINDLLKQVMNKRSNQSYGPLNLTEKENQFLDEINGHYLKSKTVITPAKPEIKFLSLIFRKHTPAKIKGELGKPRINTTLLEEEYPDVFVRYPELSDNIKNNGILRDKVLDVQASLSQHNTPSF